MRFLYNILFMAGFVVSAPFYWLKMTRRGNWRAGFGERLGLYDHKLKQALSNTRVLWLHAVSVGEVNLCTQIIRELEPRLPNHKLVVSTTTSTGMAELRRHLPSHIAKVYYPIDRRKHVQRAMNVIHPEAVVLVEAEIWPNFLWALQRRGKPAFLVNARISDRSFRGYRRFGFLFRPLFASFKAVSAQNEADAALLRELGCRPEAIHVVGSLKFDAAQLHERRLLDVPRMLRQLGVPEGAPVLVGGSTHAGEEAILARVAIALRPRFPGLFLVVVPRHHERGREVGDALAAHGMPFMYRTDVTPDTRREPGSVHALVVNTTGELRFFYEVATVVFVGKSLAAKGGQNPIEPAAMGKPVVFGPHMGNFPQVVPQFLSAHAAIEVPDEPALARALGELMADPARRESMGAAARDVVARNRGSITRTADLIVRGLSQP
jgi:3-deoxy-D-manno-octulosonic-acid transferase